MATATITFDRMIATMGPHVTDTIKHGMKKAHGDNENVAVDFTLCRKFPAGGEA